MRRGPNQFTRTFCLCLGLVFATGALANAQTRMVMHTFQNGRALIFVAVIDRSPAPHGVVRIYASGPQGSFTSSQFTVSHQQFEQMWTTLQSSLAKKYAVAKVRLGHSTAINNYVFTVGYKPKGTKTHYVVPKDRASNSLASLARQLEGYAR